MTNPMTPADLIFHNGQVLTVDSEASIQSAVAVSGKTIQVVGADNDVLSLASPETRILDLNGRTLIPGIIDIHAHMDREGLKEIFPSLSGVRSISDVLGVVRDQVSTKNPGGWVVTMPIGDPPNYFDMPQNLAVGVRYGFGTDNKPYNPFATLWAAVARTERQTGSVLGPDQHLSRMEALRVFTMGEAYFFFDETRRGSIEPGKLADMAVLSDDLLRTPEDDLPNLNSVLTTVGGRWVHQSAEL